jgi:cardiolipin synthase A/B
VGDLHGARRLITFHVFWFKPGGVAERVREILVERARAGVEVLFLLDAFGSWGLPRGYVESLRTAGVEVAFYRPFHWKTLYKAQQRMHIRAVIVDGHVAFTGGFGIDDGWQGDGRHPGQWRDTNVRVEGPVVDQLQAAFVTNWAEATGDLLLGDRVFSVDDRIAGGDTQHAGVLYSAPSLGSTNAERLFLVSIAAAQQRLYITNAYFVPNRDLRRLLIEAADRGVDVRVLTPGRNTDRRSTWYAGRSHYEELMRGGVKLYEYRPTMVHAKTFVVDGVWSCIGTLNFDNRSMMLNDEVALMVHDRAVGAQLEALYIDDLRYADEVDLGRFGERAWTERWRERAAAVMAPIL